MMTTSRARCSLPLLLALSVGIGTTVLASPARAAEVQACIARSTPLGIGADPAECAASDRVEAISVKFALLAQPAAEAIAQPSPLLLSKRLDRSSARLFLDAASRRALMNVLVVIFEENGPKAEERGRRLFSILLHNAVISAFEESAQPGRPATLSAHESVSFVYTRITLRDDISGESSCFDFTENRSC